MSAGSPHGFAGATRDLSEPSRSASGDPAASTDEHALFWAYRNMTREHIVTACVCGEDIEAENNATAVRDAVETHNACTAHQQWRAWQEC